MVTVEALACGTPVVGLDGSGTADIVISGEHGELAREGSVAALAAACRDGARPGATTARGCARARRASPASASGAASPTCWSACFPGAGTA